MAKKRLQKKLQAKAANLPVAAAIDSRERFLDGLRAFAAEDYKSAVSIWNDVLDSLPSNAELADRVRPLLAEAYFRMALAQHARGREDSALTYIHEATRLAPDDGIYHYHKGLIFHRQGNLKRAEGAYRDALTRGADTSRVLFHLGLLVLDQNGMKGFSRWLKEGEGSSLDGAWREFAMAVEAVATGANLPEIRGLKYGKKERHLGGTYILYGLAAYENGSLQDALHLFRRACDADPQNPYAFFCRGTAYAALERLDDAIGDWETALSLGLDDERIKQNLAGAQRLKLARASEKGKLDRLIMELREEIGVEGAPEKVPVSGEKASRLGLAYFARGNSFAREGKWDRAIEDWKEGLKFRPDEPDIAHNIALACEEIEDYKEAIRYWRRAISLWSEPAAPKPGEGAKAEPGKPSIRNPHYLAIAYQHLGENFAELGKSKEAIHELELAVKYSPDNTRLRAMLARLYMDGNEYVKAAEHLEEIVRREPENLEALLDLALAISELGREGEAIKLCDEVRKAQPENPVPWVAAGLVYACMGNENSAHQYIDRGLRLGSWNEELYLLIGRRTLASRPRETLLNVAIHYLEEAGKRYPYNLAFPFLHGLFSWKLSRLLEGEDIFWGLDDDEEEDEEYEDDEDYEDDDDDF